MLTHYLALLCRAGAAVIDGIVSPTEPSPITAALRFGWALLQALK